MGALISSFDARLSKKRVVIIGGSLAGLACARCLEKLGFDVAVIEPRDHLFIPFGAMRAGASADAAWAKRVTVPLDRALKRGRIIRGRALGVEPAARTVSYAPVEGGAEGSPASIAYDFLVLACGAQFATPFRPASLDAAPARAALLALGAALRGAARVVVVGGGACGIELAGEVRDAAPDAAVTLVHSGAALLSGAGNHAPPRALSDKLLERLAARGVKTVLGARVTGVAGGRAHEAMGASVQLGPLTAALSSGGELAADVLVWATGSGRPATEWLAGGPLAGAVDAAGGIKIARSYLVPGFDGIFAVGDCAAGPDAKAGWLLENVAAIVAANARALALAAPGAPPPALKEGPKDGFHGVLAVPIGRSDGAGLLPFGVVGPFLIRNIKGGDLFLSKVGGSVGYSAAELVARA
jgi:NADH dehydrogenase FAD-containing subunit